MTPRNRNSGGSFTASVNRWARLTESAMLAVAVDSIQDVLEAAQTTAQGKTAGGTLMRGRIPVVTGDLVNSLAVEVNGVLGAPGANSYVAAIGGMSLGDTLRFGWTVEYSARVHSGFSGEDSLGRFYDQKGWHWITPHAMRWPQIVARNARKHRRAR